MVIEECIDQLRKQDKVWEGEGWTQFEKNGSSNQDRGPY